MWVVKVTGRAKGKGVLTTGDVAEVEAEVGRHLRAGAKEILIERIDLWTAPE